MKFPIMFLALMFVGLQPAHAAWQDAEALAEVRPILMDAERRFVNAVSNPEIQLVRVDKVTVILPPSTESLNPLIIEDATKTPPKYNRAPKPGEPVFKRVRNFVRYLAKMQYSYLQLQAAQEKYEDALKAVQASDENFKDLNYTQYTGLEAALKDWRNIVSEVGERGISQASVAYAGQEAVLKALTD